MHTLLTSTKRLFWVYKRNFLRRCVVGFVAVANNCTSCLLIQLYLLLS